MKNITDKQRSVLAILKDSSNWSPPGISKISRILGWGNNTTALSSLRSLERKGLVTSSVDNGITYYRPVKES